MDLRYSTYVVVLVLTVISKVTYTSLLILDDVPKLHQLKTLVIGKNEIKIIEELASEWSSFGLLLKFEKFILDNIERDKVQFGCEECCQELFCRWLRGEGSQPSTWAMLVEALRNAERGILAEKLERLWTK